MSTRQHICFPVCTKKAYQSLCRHCESIPILERALLQCSLGICLLHCLPLLRDMPACPEDWYRKDLHDTFLFTCVLDYLFCRQGPAWPCPFHCWLFSRQTSQQGKIYLQSHFLCEENIDLQVWECDTHLSKLNVRRERPLPNILVHSKSATRTFPTVPSTG